MKKLYEFSLTGDEFNELVEKNEAKYEVTIFLTGATLTLYFKEFQNVFIFTKILMNGGYVHHDDFEVKNLEEDY